MFQLDEQELLAAVGQLYLHNVALQKQLAAAAEPKPAAPAPEPTGA